MIRIAGVLAVVVLTGCGPGEVERSTAEDQPRAAAPESGSSGTGTAPTPEPAPTSAPTAPAQPASAPAAHGGGDAASGAALYAQYCATCHGAGGKGDGPIGATLVPRPADHTDPKYIGSLSDEHLFSVIQKGGASVGKSSLMAGWGAVLNDGQIRDLVAHIRSISGT